MPHKTKGPPWQRDPAEFNRVCRQRYNLATQGVVRLRSLPPRRWMNFVKEITGDPLPLDELIQVYRLTEVPKPRLYLAELEHRIYGGPADSIAAFAKARMAQFSTLSRPAAIADAIATCAERGTFVGLRGAAISFDSARTLVYKAWDCAWDLRVGDTGRRIKVRVKQLGIVWRVPEEGNRILLSEGDTVPDTLQWRKFIAEGSIVAVL